MLIDARRLCVENGRICKVAFFSLKDCAFSQKAFCKPGRVETKRFGEVSKAINEESSEIFEAVPNAVTFLFIGPIDSHFKNECRT